MGKVAVAGKVDPEILEALEGLKEREHLKSMSQTVEFALRDYFDNEHRDTRGVTSGYPEEKGGGNAFHPLLERIEDIELRLGQLKKDAEALEKEKRETNK